MTEPRTGALRSTLSELVERVRMYGFPEPDAPDYAEAIDRECRAVVKRLSTPEAIARCAQCGLDYTTEQGVHPHLAGSCGSCGTPGHYAGDNRHDCGKPR